MPIDFRLSARRACPPRSRGGFTLIELLVVIFIGSVLAATAMIAMPGVIRASKADGEMNRMVSALKRARDFAVTQRRNVLLQFPSANSMQLVRQDIGAGGALSGSTVLEQVTFENRFVYQLLPGVGDTPDAFGASSARDFGSAISVMFTSEGGLVDQTGDPVNGTIFIGADTDVLSARAATVLGTTGLVTGYRWNGRQWVK